MKKQPLLILLIFLAILGCEKDDICSEDTTTTPQLIIRFYDAATPEETKAVSSLFVYGVNDVDETVFFKNLTISSTDSITVPLRVDTNMTKLVFHKDLADISDLLVGNPDNVDITYTREDVYVSRACGYKAIYTNLNAIETPDGDNWISSIAIENNVENETSAHVKIYH